MALDPALMDKFERDWNEALEVYEARTTAARLGDTSVDPFRRTTLDPKVAAGMQSELFGPLSAKWGLLTEGAGRRSAASPQSTMEWSTPMNVGGGEVLRFNRATGEKEILNPFRTSTSQSAADKEALGIRQKKLASDISSIDRQMTEQRRLLAGLDKVDKKDRPEKERLIRRELLSLSRRRDSLFAPPEPAPVPVTNAPSIMPDQLAVHPSNIPPGGSPGTGSFMGDPMNPVIQDPPPAPLPVGPSVQRGIRVLNIRPTK